MGKKFRVLVIVGMLFFLGSALNAADNLKIGVGYQGMYLGGLLQGLSARGWMGPIGFEGNIFQGNLKLNLDDGETSSDLVKASAYAIGLKGMFAPIVKANSKFYAGLDINYGYAKIDSDELEDIGSVKPKIWFGGPFFGAEYFFQEMPELGWNWEVGYKFSQSKLSVDSDDTSTDLKLDVSGINVELGVHYYF